MEQTKIRENTAQTEQIRVDFKMVTFTLAGKDYGIDIMKVKEISKAAKFTFVPMPRPSSRVSTISEAISSPLSTCARFLIFPLRIHWKKETST
jgi:hypothetical protein